MKHFAGGFALGAAVGLFFAAYAWDKMELEGNEGLLACAFGILGGLAAWGLMP